jgi:predicted Zn-dependent protease
MAFMALTLAACGTVNPATGKRDFTPFMSPSDEMKVGQQEHPNVVKEFGGVYDNAQVAGYVAAVGGRLAANSDLPQMEFTFTVLDSPIVNAFALPGGYVYVTRGILSLFNSEAELASVLGHEIGHVTARHTAKRYNQAMFAGILGAGLGVALNNSAASELFNYGSQLYLLGFSRDQEYQSDELGVRYMTKAGYDPYASADMLRALQRQDALAAKIAQSENSSRPPEFFSTHPNTANRVQKATDEAAGTGVPLGARPRLKDRFLDALDGMLYGDNPEQGLIRGLVFWHPKMRFTFTVPEGYRLINTADAVLAQGPEGAGAILTLNEVAAGSATSAAMATAWKAFAGDKALQEVDSLTINGMEATTGWTQARTKSGDVVARIVTIRYSPTRTYHFLMVTPVGLMDQLSEGLRRMTYSFRKIADDEVDKIRPLKIEIVTVRRGDTPTSLSKRMAFEDYQLDRFLMLNGLDAGAQLKAGDRVKLVVSD